MSLSTGRTWTCRASGCTHKWSLGEMTDAQNEERRRIHGTQVYGRTTIAVCVCCEGKPTNHGGQTEVPFPCDESTDRCLKCFTINGEHAANCRTWRQ